MNEIHNAFKELMSSNNCSIYDIAYSSDFDIDDYKEYLLEKMRGRADIIFMNVNKEIKKLSNVSSSVKQIRISDINGYENRSGMNITFISHGKEYIIIYNLWDMINYPKEKTDSITLIKDYHESDKDIDDSIAIAVSPFLNITTTDVNTKIAVGDISIDDSLSVIKNILKVIDNHSI